MTWEEKAEWLRSHGWQLVIEPNPEEEEKWEASIAGEGRKQGATIGEAVEKVYEWVTTEWPKIRPRMRD